MQSLNRIFRILRAKAHSSGGWLAYKLGWHGTARRQFERVLLLRGADFRAYVHLGRIAFDHGDYAGWRREFEHARRTDPIRFARLRHPIELFEPRLAGTQFEGSHELDSFQAADSRATWRALHPFGPDSFGSDSFGGADSLGGLEGGRNKDGRLPDGFGRGTELPLAPGYDPMTPGQQTPGQQLDDLDPDVGPTGSRGDGSGDDENSDDRSNTVGPNDSDSSSAGTGNVGTGNTGTGNTERLDLDALAGDPLGQEDAQRQDRGRHPGWNMPDASLSRDDFASPIERRRFQLRRPIDRQEIARCDFNELARRLSS
tara:strand:- start:491 stop:1432 length:942 start_codon:yes stop_codon:yes gene_type:complete